MKRDGCARIPDLCWLIAADEAGIGPATGSFHQMLRRSAGHGQRRDHRRLAREPPIRETRLYKSSDLIVGHTPDSTPSRLFPPRMVDPGTRVPHHALAISVSMTDQVSQGPASRIFQEKLPARAPRVPQQGAGAWARQWAQSRERRGRADT